MFTLFIHSRKTIHYFSHSS